ncbi:inactive pancreatic lipase-related protein 1-like [Culicoides brevitarsis]|uniref:inactive pancreatic lipase-related protein 1-like n=1 Tax=Culicoides brevitarsis TaxID=469753 RepID=UPI00307BF4E6
MTTRVRNILTGFLAFLSLSASNCHILEFGPCLLQYLEPCTNNTIQFYLFTSDRPRAAPVLMSNEDPVMPKTVNATHDLKLIVHGYAGNLDFNATKSIRNAYLAKNATNILIVDWGKLAKYPCYPTAAFNTRQAGECIAKFLTGLQKNSQEFNISHVHAIGFSLGAHVVAFTSNVLKNSTGKGLSRITGLDPALPFFATTNPEWKLDETDADFVDVIHTNSGLFGKIERCGHVDFYINGGQYQPQCRRARNRPLCSHMLATEYFAESIWNSDGFWGLQCSGYLQYLIGWCQNTSSDEYEDDDEDPSPDPVALMGENTSLKARGVYYIVTNTVSPYAKGQKGLRTLLRPLIENIPVTYNQVDETQEQQEIQK